MKNIIIVGTIFVAIVTTICVIVMSGINQMKGEFMNNAMHGYYASIEE